MQQQPLLLPKIEWCEKMYFKDLIAQRKAHDSISSMIITMHDRKNPCNNNSKVM